MSVVSLLDVVGGHAALYVGDVLLDVDQGPLVVLRGEHGEMPPGSARLADRSLGEDPGVPTHRTSNRVRGQDEA